MSSAQDKESLVAENELLRKEIERMRLLLQRQERPQACDSDSIQEQTFKAVSSDLPEQKDANEQGEGCEQGSFPPATVVRAFSPPQPLPTWTWSWQQLDGSWQEYDPSICNLIEQAFQGGQRAVCPSHNSVIVFGDMEEQFVEDGEGADEENRFHSKPVKRHQSFGRAPVLLALRTRNLGYKEASLRARTEALILHDKSNSTDANSIAEVGIGCSLGHDPLSGNIFIAHIRTDSAAALSGKLAAGDVLVKIDGERVTRMEDASLLIGPVGSVVEVELMYGETTVSVSVVRKSYASISPMYTFLNDLEHPEKRYKFDIGVEVDLIGGKSRSVLDESAGRRSDHHGQRRGELASAPDDVEQIDGCDVVNEVVTLEGVRQVNLKEGLGREGGEGKEGTGEGRGAEEEREGEGWGEERESERVG
eukprot:768310-Hanusia_phi.AAC.2